MINKTKVDKILVEDLKSLVDDSFFSNSFSNTTVLVTGATGLIGSQIVRTLVYFNLKKKANIRIIALVRDEIKARKTFSDILNQANIEFWIGDITHPLNQNVNVDYIFHGASATSSKYFVSNPVETLRVAIQGTSNILEFAKRASVKGIIYLSSLEVYGQVSSNAGFISESSYGYIDPLNVRSSYSEGKRIAECICCSYCKEYNIPVKIARLSQTFGAGVESTDNRVFAEFAKCVLKKKDIVLHTAGNTVRTYCYTKDAISGLFYILLRGNQGEAYNVTNMETAISIREMAQLVCDLYPDSKISVVYDTPKDVNAFGYNPEMVIKLDSHKLMELGWKPSVSLSEMFKRMIESMQYRYCE